MKAIFKDGTKVLFATPGIGLYGCGDSSTGAMRDLTEFAVVTENNSVTITK